MNESSDRKNIEEKYKRKNSLIRMKYLEFVPILFVTNMSTLLLTTIDGLVVGNLMGADALAAINMFNPVVVLLSAYIAVIVNGIADGYSDILVKNNHTDISHCKKAVVVVAIVSAIVLSIIQMPIAKVVIRSLELDDKMYKLVRTYAAATLIAMPFRLVSEVGAGLLKEFGKMKVLMVISAIECIINLILDLIFVGIFKMGVYGTGIATVFASIIRTIITVIYYKTKTNMFDMEQAKVKLSYVKDLVEGGLPYLVGVLTSAVHSYLMMKIAIYAYGNDGGVIIGVCNLCISIAMVFIASSSDSNGPLMGIFMNIGDRVAMRDAMRIAVRQIVISVGLFVLLIELKPEWFYYINGITEIPQYGIMALRLNALFYVFFGCSALFEAYFIDTQRAKVSVRFTFFSDLFIPLLALAIFKIVGKQYMWISDFIIDFFVLANYLKRYFNIVLKEEEKETKNSDILYLEVEPIQATSASQNIQQYAKEKKYSDILSNRLAMCIEEMVEYATKSQHSLEIHIQIIINFFKNGVRFVMLDDGKRLNFNKVKDHSEIVTNNYELVKKLSKSYKYQYILNMNHTTLEF